MGVYIPNVDEKKFYEICKEHNLDFIAIPATDVREAVKARWIKMKFFPDWECEKCACVVSGNTPDPWNHYPFCPNCWAMMEKS